MAEIFAKTEKNGTELTAYLFGRIDSSTVDMAKDVILPDTDNVLSLMINCENLEYISSAGLRLILLLNKKVKNTQIIEVSSEVYEIFEMTGFTSMINIKRRMREFSLEGCTEIGAGAVGTVYRYNEDTIIKVYKEGMKLDEIMRERDRGQTAFIHGIPTAISFDIVKVGNRYGLLYELLNSSTIGKNVSKKPDQAERYAVKFAELLKEIQTISADGFDIPRAKDFYTDCARTICSDFLDEETAAEYMNFMSYFPDGECIVHGDYHPKNIMMQDDKPLLIDMGDLCIGSKWVDPGVSYFVLKTIDNSEHCSGIPDAVNELFFSTFVKTYFETEDPDELASIYEKLKLLATIRETLMPAIFSKCSESLIMKVKSTIKDDLIKNSDHYIDLMKSM